MFGIFVANSVVGNSESGVSKMKKSILLFLSVAIFTLNHICYAVEVCQESNTDALVLSGIVSEVTADPEGWSVKIDITRPNYCRGIKKIFIPKENTNIPDNKKIKEDAHIIFKINKSICSKQEDESYELIQIISIF